jgi:AcrR family transcriptional regulator
MNEKEKIENYTTDLFLQSGFYKITMDEIAKGLRISKKTIYKYFPSKNFLVDTIMKAFMLKVRNKLLKQIEKEDNAILKIKALTELFAELSLKLNEKMLFDLQTHRPDLWDSLEKFRGEMITNIWGGIIDQGKKEGYIINIPNDIIITVILSSVRSVIIPSFLLEHGYSLNKAFNITFDLLINGILTDEGLKVYKTIERDSKNEKI